MQACSLELSGQARLEQPDTLVRVENLQLPECSLLAFFSHRLELAVQLGDPAATLLS